MEQRGTHGVLLSLNTDLSTSVDTAVSPATGCRTPATVTATACHRSSPPHHAPPDLPPAARCYRRRRRSSCQPQLAAAARFLSEAQAEQRFQEGRGEARAQMGCEVTTMREDTLHLGGGGEGEE